MASGDGAAARRRLLELLAEQRGRRLALYAALPGEVSLEPVADALRARGWELVFPRVEGRDLAFCPALPDELRPGFRGVREPVRGMPAVPIESIDVFVVPGLWFDRSGWRLGRGRAHYDRALRRARADALKIGLCYAERVADRLPRASWDVAMNWVVSDRALYRAGEEDGA